MPEPQPGGAVLPQEVIRAKRDGATLDAETMGAFIEGIVAARVSGEQAAAFLMAAFLRGLGQDETVALTTAMTRSGVLLQWPDLDGPVLDKHSTGGIGDNVSLMLAPAVAACGGFVPMISGRGLGHSGGTLDKLDAIPGYQTQPSLDGFRATVKAVGCAVIGQTADLAPADRILYVIRDVTATVESIPLITASILSKKLAAGLGGLVMDVKTGSGAFMVGRAEAGALAESIVAVARGAGLLTTALITDMDQPLASAAGNAVEVVNAIDFLTGVRRDPRLEAVVTALGAEMLLLGGLAGTSAEGHTLIENAIASGAAAERFARMIAALGGPVDLIEKPDAYLPRAPVSRRVEAERPGWVTAIDTRAIGLAVVSLGGGRIKPTDTIDPAVGFSELAPVGADVASASLGVVHARSEAMADVAEAALRRACRIDDRKPPEPRNPVIDRMAEAHVR